ncbi:MAG: hypothetical protein U9N53_02220 [Bacteroidota bacterium]|nr:hypothetical protein [Bacteroidota bacterium]
MKNSIIILFTILVTAIISCNKEDEPFAAFKASATSVVVGEEITFTITGNGEFWSFWPGAGESSGTNIDEDVFYHSYGVPGIYNARIVASNFLDDYTVLRDSAIIQITVTDNEDHAFTRFSSYSLSLRANNFAGFEDKNLKMTIEGYVNDNEVTLEVPNSVVLDALKAKFFIASSSSAYVGTVMQVSRVTANDFNNPVEYRIVALDSSEEISTVTVNRLDKSGNSQLMSFDLGGLPAGISTTVTQEGNDVKVLLSDSANLSALKAEFAIQTFSRAYIGAVEQESGNTVNDFSSVVVYNIKAEDGTESDYNIDVLSSPVLARFYFGEGNPFVAEGIFNATLDTVFVDVPDGSDLSSLKASFITRPYDCVVKVGANVQQSGVTANDFSSPLTYILLSGDIEKEFIVAIQ